jgi:6-phosphogluconate dehydrogenase
MMGQQVGLVGLAVMGENLALNIERNGFSMAVYNRSYDKTDAFLRGRAAGKQFVGPKTVAEFVQALDRPRRIILLVKAGPPVDAILQELRPHLEPGDIVVDGGNSHYPDTDRRIQDMAAARLSFVGMGVSGGEEGALNGPSLMPGGDVTAYRALEPILTRIAARSASGACVTHVGTGSAGHFVKMVHNGIEYGDMQLIAETYDLLRHALGLSTAEIAALFAEWNAGELQSYLIEITAKVVNHPDDQGGRRPLIDRILDRAGQKGTGKWTTMAAFDLAAVVPTMTAAVDARLLSGMLELRQQAAKTFPGRITPIKSGRAAWIDRIRAALYAAKICSYAQGFDLLRRASATFGYGLKLDEIARIWTGGCIIRAALLADFQAAFQRDPELPNLLLDRKMAQAVRARTAAWRDVVSLGVKLGVTAPALSASLAYFDGVRRARLPTALIQEQRDFFGAHTYERTDQPGAFHTDWSKATLPAPAAKKKHVRARPRR